MAPSTRSSRALYDYFEPSPELDAGSIDVEMTTENDEQGSGEHETLNNIRKDRIVIAIDFGTTFSSVSYAVLPKGVPPERITIRKVKCIGRYPGYETHDSMLDTRQDVPTELWYSLEEEPCSRGFASTEEDSSSSEDDLTDGGSPGFEDDGGLKADAARRRTVPRNAPVTQFWGFNVQKHLNTMNIPRDEVRPLTRFKLNLDNTEQTRDLRTELDTILSTLRTKNMISDKSKIYADYLTHLLRHSEDQLQRANELREGMVYQFVLCVPAKWPVAACRTMQNALEQAVERSGFDKAAQEGVRNLFMISEPEAAAGCILSEAKSDLYVGETVVMVDAGGGTIDAVTYKCAHDEPLRLSEEVVAPDSELLGASFINEAFEKKLLEKLKDEDYLFVNGKTLRSIVQKCSTLFENNEKRKIDVNDMKSPIAPIYVDNLRENPSKHFYQNRLKLRRKTVRHFYKEPLRKVESVLESQLARAENENHTVQKVILTGGFGQSPSLQSSLRNYLKERPNNKGLEIELIVPRNPSTAVARGAVLRALNKNLGPSRISQCSYGFLMSEPFEPHVLREHKRMKGKLNKADGEYYIDDTIHWVIQQGDRVENMEEHAFDVKHTFPLDQTQLQAAEQLWMSDRQHPQHYRKTHPLNKGAKKIGTIVADLTELLNKGLIEPESPSEFSTHAKTKKKHWAVYYEIVMVVEGRSIRFEARWPSKADRKQGQSHKHTFATKLVGIAAAFKPGTA